MNTHGKRLQFALGKVAVLAVVELHVCRQLLLSAASLLHAVASQGPQCRVPVGLLILLFMHVKLPAFRDFANL